MGNKSWLICVCLLLSCCTVVKENPLRDISNSFHEDGNTSIYTIEIDDSGSFLNDFQVESLLKRVKGESVDSDLILFTHGWHHNADLNDKNYIDFTHFVDNFAKKHDRKTIGVYLGWRGDLINSFFDNFLPEVFTDFWTIKSRKNASIMVGKHGISSLVRSIDNVKSVKIKNIILIGHSLGGSAVFHSAIEIIRLGHLNNAKFILLNPAISSHEYRSLKEFGFSETVRLPTIITMQSNNDRAIGWAYQLAYLKKPAGFNNSLITHDLWACDEVDVDCMEMLKEKSDLNECARRINNGTWYLDARDNNGKRAPTCHHAWKRFDWVIDARYTISASHNDILTDSQADSILELLISAHPPPSR